MVALVAYAFQTKEQFYPTLVYLSQSKTSFVLSTNMVIACAILIGKIFKVIFFGSLRGVETEMLYERAKYSATETCLALTVFRSEISPKIFLFFGSMIFVKAFHWLAKSRLEYNEQIQPLPLLAHIRMIALIATLMFVDISVTRYCINYTFDQGQSVFILFGFEFGLLVIDVFNLAFRYIIGCIDACRENGFQSKGIALMLIDLFSDALRFITYSFFFCLIFVYYGLPIHIVREVWLSFLAFQSKLASFIKYLQLNHNLDQRFDDATEEELASAGVCLICFEQMTTGKKLPPPCGHVFHLDCLRGWFQYRQDCPTCRRDIPLTTTRSTRATAAANAMERRNNAGEVERQQGENEARVDTDDSNSSANRANAGDNSASAGVSNRSGGGTCIPIPSSPSSSSNFAMTDQPEFPAFYKIISPHATEVRIAPSSTSFTVRLLSNQIVVLALEKFTEETGDWWLHIPDGWIHAGRAEGLTHEAEDFVKIFKCEPGQTLETAERTKKKIERAKAINRTERHRSLLPQSADPSVMINKKSSSKSVRKNVGGTSSPKRDSSIHTFSDPVLRKLDFLESQLAQMSSILGTAQDMVSTLREEHLTKMNVDEVAMKINEKVLEMSQAFGEQADVPTETEIIEEHMTITADEEEEALKALRDANEEVLRLGEHKPLKGVKSNEVTSLEQEGENEEMEKVDGKTSSLLPTNNDDMKSSPSLREIRAKFFASSSTGSAGGDHGHH